MIYRGDMFSILPTWPEGCVDVVITDPPYGMAARALEPCLRIAKRGVIMLGPLRFTGEINPRQNEKFDPMQDHQTEWAFWGGFETIGIGSIFVWGESLGHPGPFKVYRPNLRDLSDHPGAKPNALFGDILDAIDPASVCDPFAGLGPTAIEAEKRGIPWRVVELDPVYAGRIRERVHGDEACLVDES